MKKYFQKLKEKLDESPAFDKMLISSGKALDVVNSTAEILVHIGPQLTMTGGVALASRVVSTMRNSRLLSATEYFEGEGWVRLNLYGFEKQAWRFAHAEDGATALPIPSTYADEQAYIVEGLGPDIGFSMNGGSSHAKINKTKLKADCCWVRTEGDREGAMVAIGRGLWGDIRGSNALLVKDSSDGIAVIPDDDEETLASKRGDEVYKKLKRYLEKGIHRSVFMIGEAGVGKSHMLRYIAKLNGGLVLRIKIADLVDVSPTKMVKTVELLRPDVMIIDDFDRFVIGTKYRPDAGDGADQNVAKILDPLQQLNRLVKLFMVSANYSENISSAVLRPGRFDELIHVDELDPELYEKLLPDAPKKLIAKLKKESPPIAYIAELKKRVDVLGYKEASLEMEDLIERSGRILKLNARKAKGKRKSRRKQATLVGQTKLRQAILMEQRAARQDKAALKAQEEALRATEGAKEWREKAEGKRLAAEKEKAEAKEKPKVPPKKKAKKKAVAKTAEARDTGPSTKRKTTKRKATKRKSTRRRKRKSPRKVSRSRA